MKNFKLVVMSATLDVSLFYQRAYEAGLNREAVDHMIMEERTKTIEQFVLPPSTADRDNLEMAVRAVVQFHNTHPKEYKKTTDGTILVFVSGKAEINAFIDILTNLQNRGFTSNLYPYAFHADLSYKDKEMLMEYPIKDEDKRGNPSARRRALISAATNRNWDKEGRTQRTATKPDYKNWSPRTVIVATNAAETGVTFEKCILVVDTCLVNVIYHDPSTNVKVQATMPCSKAASEQRAGRTGRDKDGQCVRLVTQDQWNRMPLRDPIQPRLMDHTQLYLRLSMPDVADLRATLLQKMSMTDPMKQRAMQKLTLLGMYNQDGTLTALGEFAAKLGCEPENAALLWYANEFQVMEDALTIFAILERGPAFASKEQRIKVPHPDGDMHSMVNVWNYFQWLDYRTCTLSKDEKERIWSKEHVSFRTYQTVYEFRKDASDRCQERFSNWSVHRDETYSSRLALALFKAYKLTLMIRDGLGNYSSVTDYDEWRFGSNESKSSILKFQPQFIIAPGRMVRMMAMGSKPASTRIDLAMGVPLEFLASEMWFCTNCCKNKLFKQVLEDVRNLPILSNMTIMERLCPAIGVCPVPYTRDSGVVNPDNAGEFLRPMKWIYDRPASDLHEHAIKYRVDTPIKISDLRLSEDKIVPSFTILLYTINFGEATDSKTEGMVYRPDGWTIGNQLYIVPAYEDNDTLKKRWLSTVAPLPTAEPGYKERMAFSDTHEKVDQDFIEPGGDTADMDAAVAEMEQEKIKEQKDTSFGQTTFACGASVYDDPRGFIADEYRPSLTCTLCQPDPLRTADAPFSGRKFYSLTSHVTFTHDACVYPSSRGYTYQQLVGGRQVCAARCWMNSAMVEQTKEQQGQKPRSWSERKLTRVQGQSDTNGDLAPLQLVNQNRHTDHYHAPAATPEIDKKNSHMLVRDEYPEVVHAERSAESDERYHVPNIVPEVMVDWVTRLVNNEPAIFYQMDPLSSPHELNPIYSEKTPLLWFTPADMKMFLRLSDENLEDAWRRAMSLLCFTIRILREACEFTDFRQTSFGSTYMALLGCAQVMKIGTLWTEEAGRRGVILAKSQEGLYMNPQDSTFMADQWETMGSGSEVKVGPESSAIVYANDALVGISTDCRALTKETCGIAIVDDQQSLIADLILDLGLTKSRLVAGAIQRKEEYLRTWVDAYHLYKDKCKSPNNVKNMLKDRLRESWDSWPNKVWRVTDEGVQLVREQIARPKPERSTGILQCFWNTLRKKPSAPSVKQEEPEDMDMAINPDSWTGDMPLNALVTLECHNRPDQLPFINATNEAKQSHDDDQIVMPCKCPAAFEWKANRGWNAEERLQQRIHLEASKDPHLWDGPLGHKVQAYKNELETTWGNKKKGKQAFWDCLQDNASSLSEEEKVLLRWMCIHVTIGRNCDKQSQTRKCF